MTYACKVSITLWVTSATIVAIPGGTSGSLAANDEDPGGDKNGDGAVEGVRGDEVAPDPVEEGVANQDRSSDDELRPKIRGLTEDLKAVVWPFPVGGVFDAPVEALDTAVAEAADATEVRLNPDEEFELKEKISNIKNWFQSKIMWKKSEYKV